MYPKSQKKHRDEFFKKSEESLVLRAAFATVMVAALLIIGYVIALNSIDILVGLNK